MGRLLWTGLKLKAEKKAMYWYKLEMMGNVE